MTFLESRPLRPALASRDEVGLTRPDVGRTTSATLTTRHRLGHAFQIIMLLGGLDEIVLNSLPDLQMLIAARDDPVTADPAGQRREGSKSQQTRSGHAALSSSPSSFTTSQA